MNVGVVGFGWLGLPLAKDLSKKGFNVWGTVRSVEKQTQIQESSGLQTQCWDNSKPVSILQSQLSETDLLIITLPPSSFEGNSYAETVNSLAQFLPQTGKVIFTSSIGIYPNESKEMDENESDLKCGKILDAENALRKWSKNKLSVLRLGGLIGEDRNPAKYLVRKEINDRPNQKVQLIHQEDVIRVIHEVVEQNKFGETFNVVHPGRPTREKYYTYMADKLNLGSIRFDKEQSAEGKNINVSKLRNELGFRKFKPLLS